LARDRAYGSPKKFEKDGQMMRYTIIEVFTSEDIRWHGNPVHTAIVNYVSGLKIAARCIVTRGKEGCYENGQVATFRIEVLSLKMPVKLEIILPSAEVERVLPTLQEMVCDGILCTRDLNVVVHRVRKHLLPHSLLVRDIMTANPARVTPSTTADDVMRLLLSAEFNGVPVVDEEDRPIGIITQGDLIKRGAMPLRLGLMRHMVNKDENKVMKTMAGRTAGEIMTTPVVNISGEQRVTEAVDMMLSHSLKRMPVIGADGRIVGMLSRFDIFRTVTKDIEKWEVARTYQISVNPSAPVQTVMRKDTHSVSVDTTLEEIVRTIDSNDIQRLVVVDAAGRLLGMISDHDLLILFSEHTAGLWDTIASKLTFTEMGRRHRQALDQASRQTAGELMKTELVTIDENTSIDDAIRIMTEKSIKRLPVVDKERIFKGMISRDSLLRAGVEDAPPTP